MIHFAVIGSPIAHSRSPQIYNELFKKHGIEADFIRLLVEPCEIADIRNIASELSGFAVTMPHKRAIIPYLDALAPSALACGSVNIVERRQDKLIGHNTDGDGLADALADAGVDVRGKRALILGRGGAALSAACALTERGCETELLVRTLSRSPKYGERLLDPDNMPHAEIFINASPLGMQGANDFASFDFLDSIAPLVVFDMVYRPDRETSLMREALQRGMVGLDGNEMLLKQALRAFEIWFGVKA